jgi:hypothetical protein
LKAARTVLSALKTEFLAAGKSGGELRRIMNEELDAAITSFELTTTQRDLLWRELEHESGAQKVSRASIETGLASKLPVLAALPQGFAEQTFEGSAKQALPTGTEEERAEFRRYWGDLLYRERERQSSDRERNERQWLAPNEGLKREKPNAASHRPIAGAEAASDKTAIGRNIDKLRKECGWSFDDLARKTGFDKKVILNHVNKGARPRPKNLKVYADAFAKTLSRTVTVAELES